MADAILDLLNSTAASAPPLSTAATTATTPAPSTAILSMLDQGIEGKLPAPSSGVSAAKLTGPVANFGAGASDVIADTLGMPVDLVTRVLRSSASSFPDLDTASMSGFAPSIASRAQLSGPTVAAFNSGTAKPVGGSDWWKSAMGVIGANPNNVAPSNSIDQLARAGGGGAAAMIAPVGGIPESGVALARLLGIGATAGAGGDIAAANVPAPYKPLANVAGQLAAGGIGALADTGASMATREAGNFARPFVANFSPKAAETIAAQRLQSAATNAPAAATTATAGLDEQQLVPGSQPTLGQITGDPGLLALERTQATKNPDLFKARQAEQQEAQVGALNEVQPTGSPAAVGAFVKQQLDALDGQRAADIGGLQARATEATGLLGGQGTAHVYGSTIRGVLSDAQREAKANEGRLWDAIDPTGNLTIDARPTARAAQDILSQIPETAAKPAGEERAIYDAAQDLGGNTPFRNLAALKSRLGDELRAQRYSGGSPTLIRRLSMLQDAISQNIADGAEGLAQREQQSVATGQMAPEDAMTARLATLAQQHYAAQNVRAPDAIANLATRRAPATGFTGVPGSGPPVAFGSNRTGLPPGGRFGITPGNPSLSTGAQTLAPSFDADAAARYRTAANATRERVATFGKGSVGQVLRQGESAGSFRLSDSAVAAKFFNKGTHAAEDIQGFTNAAGGRDEAEAALREYAALDLRRAATRADGTLDPAKVQRWIGAHSDALQAFPDLASRFSGAGEAQQLVDNVVADRADALKDQSRYAAAKFIGSDPVTAFGAALKSKNPAGELAKLSRWASLDKTGEAGEGLRRAAVEYMQQRFLTESGGNQAIKAQQFQTFLRQSRGALTNVLGPERVRLLDNIAADLQRTNPMQAKLPGPGTAQDLTGIRKTAREAGEHHGGNLLAYLIGLGAEHMTGDLLTSMGLALGVKGAEWIRAAGLRNADDLVTEGLLNPELGRLMLMKITPSTRANIAARLRSQLQKLSAAVPLATATRRGSPGFAPSMFAH